MFFFSSRRRHTRWTGHWSSDVCSSDLGCAESLQRVLLLVRQGVERITLIELVRRTVEVVRTRLGDVVDHRTHVRSEERRVGKECRSRRARNDEKKKLRR